MQIDGSEHEAYGRFDFDEASETVRLVLQVDEDAQSVSTLEVRIPCEDFMDVAERLFRHMKSRFNRNVVES